MENSFPSTLTALRKANGLTQKEAAKQLGISQALLSHYENGIRECSLDFLIKTAEKNGIPYTVEVMGSRTMTDSDVAVTAGKGIRTGLVSVPLTNMHTPVETLDIRDVDSVASVLAAAAKEVM